jgi:hypothetical protein
VAVGPTATATPTPSPSPTPAPIPSPTASPTPSPTPSPSASPAPTATPTPTAAPTTSPTPTPTTLTSTLNLTSANNRQTFSNYRISTTSGPCVQGNRVSNATIENSNIGPCGTNGNGQSRGIYFSGGSGNKVDDSYIHPETLSTSLETHCGILASGSTSLTAQGNVIAYGEANVCLDNSSTGASIYGNALINPRGNTDAFHQVGVADGSNNATISTNYMYACTLSGSGLGGITCPSSPTYLLDMPLKN